MSMERSERLRPSPRIIVGVVALLGGLLVSSGGASRAQASDYVALGDSLAAGSGASSPANSYVGILFASLRSELGVTQLFNRARPGEKSDSLRTEGQLAAALGDINAASDTAAVTIDIGGNDGLAAVPCPSHWDEPSCPFRASFAATLDDLATALAADPGDEVLAVMAYYNPEAGTGTAQEAYYEHDLFGDNGVIGLADAGADVGLNDVIYQEAVARAVPVADPYRAFEANGQAFMADSIHANDAGHAAIAEAFCEVMNVSCVMPPPPPPPPDTTLKGTATASGTQRQYGRRIVVRVKVRASEALTAKARGTIKLDRTYELRPRTAELHSARTTTLKLKPKQRAQAKRIAMALKRGKAATARLTVSLADEAGNRKREKLRVRLRRKPGAHRLFGAVTQGALDQLDFQRMRRGGVSSLRFLLDRRQVEREAGTREWWSLDPLVAEASRQGIDLLPFVFGSPGSAPDNSATPPIHSREERRTWKSFLRALVRRYGRGGSFWAGWDNPRPITTWQVWNEPNLRMYWKHPDPEQYARLLRISAAAIRGVDERARIMLAGLAPTRAGIPADRFLAELYHQRHIRRDFDIVALHPYAARIQRLREQIVLMRSVMAGAGDGRTPLAVTELGWASQEDPAMAAAGGARHAMIKGLEGQAAMLRRAFALLRRKRAAWSLERVEWFAFKDATGAVESVCDFCRYAGLFSAEGDRKPAWRAFRHLARRGSHRKGVLR